MALYSEQGHKLGMPKNWYFCQLTLIARLPTLRSELLFQLHVGAEGSDATTERRLELVFGSALLGLTHPSNIST